MVLGSATGNPATRATLECIYCTEHGLLRQHKPETSNRLSSLQQSNRMDVRTWPGNFLGCPVWLCFRSSAIRSSSQLPLTSHHLDAFFLAIVPT